MSKRFIGTETWEEDWFLDMPNEYKLFWFYILAKCDHAGIFKVNMRPFRGLIEGNLTSTEALEHLNKGKQRVRVISENLWFIEDFIVYQYGTTLNSRNRLHESILNVLKKHNLNLTSIRGLKDLKDGVKDKDKEIQNTESKNTVKTLRAIRIDESGEKAIFENGYFQDLGPEQKRSWQQGTLEAHYIRKGKIE